MRLRLATLNVWGIPLFSEHVGARMREIGRRLARLDLDAIAFQEVWTAGARRTLIEAGHAAGLVHAWHRRRIFVSSGLLVLSRLPIGGADFDRFALRGAASEKDELLGGKGFAELVLRTPLGGVALVDTHLHAGAAGEGELGARAHRTAQIVQLCVEARRLAEPLLVMGDFNCLESDPEHAVIRGLTGLRDLAAETDRRAPTALRANPYRRGSPKGDRRIDYVFARDGDAIAVRPVSVERIFDEPFWIEGREAACSDHAGVLAELELAPAQRSGRTAADLAALDLASQLLSDGAEAARRERQADRAGAGLGIAAAALAATGSRALHTSRRSLLRGTLSFGALLALAPSLEFSLSSEWLVPGVIDAYGEARALLARMRTEHATSRLASASEARSEA